jgi:hypothetical protein
MNVLAFVLSNCLVRHAPHELFETISSQIDEDRQLPFPLRIREGRRDGFDILRRGNLECLESNRRTVLLLSRHPQIRPTNSPPRNAESRLIAETLNTPPGREPSGENGR